MPWKICRRWGLQNESARPILRHGGFSLAARWAGWHTVAFCEQDKFCKKVLKKHWPNAPCFDDIKTLKGSDLNEIGTIDVVCGGFPCQPFSGAGQQRGADDDRYLWPEMLRIIGEIRPRWVIGENVAGIINLALDNAISDLEDLGYTVRTFNIPAVALDAQHERQRIWIVANTSGKRLQNYNPIPIPRITPYTGFTDTDHVNGLPAQQDPRSNRNTHGVSDRMDKNWRHRVKALGNSIVPQIAYQIFDAINQVESQIHCEVSAHG